MYFWDFKEFEFDLNWYQVPELPKLNLNKTATNENHHPGLKASPKPPYRLL